MTEFEELALKKITKDYLINCIYEKINSVSGRYGISNAEISKHIGWDPAGFNQKYNRSNDLRITTFIKIFVALRDLITERELEIGLQQMQCEQIRLEEFITDHALDVGMLFNHISSAAEGRTNFLAEKYLAEIFVRMRPFVLSGSKSKRFNEREIEVYILYYRLAIEICTEK